MNYRDLIFDDMEEIRKILWNLFGNKGYEVFTFPHQALCPLTNHNFRKTGDPYVSVLRWIIFQYRSATHKFFELLRLMTTSSSLPFFTLLRIAQYDKKTELGAEERIPIFFFESPLLRGCDITRSGQNIIYFKNL